MVDGNNETIDNESYFGVFSQSQKIKASALLNALGVRYEFRVTPHLDDDILAYWGALDDSSRTSKVIYDLWVLRDDISKIGFVIKDNFPEKDYIK